MAERAGAAWTAFLAMSFAVVGLTGVFATYAAPLPLERALHRDAALDATLAVIAAGADPRALDALRPALGDSAEAVLHGTGAPASRIRAERAAMHAHFLAEARAEAAQLRLLIVVITVMAAIFGAVLLRIGRATQ
ncbi:MAG: hypothetical protein JO264_17790 [Acidisphaera sp.]|nr:hypothetical protein [Acidisphaera sp.]